MKLPLGIREGLDMGADLELRVRGSDEVIHFTPGTTTIIVGPNGAGKTRLAVECERQLGEKAHRISAQRLLAIDTSIARVGEEAARSALRYGQADTAQWGGPLQARTFGRWKNGAPKFILDDSDALLQVLFAEQANTAVDAYNAYADGMAPEPRQTLIRRLRELFCSVLPARDLKISADNIEVLVVDDGSEVASYPASQMSDGEKSVFYLIGQVLVAETESVFIMDEPEVHIHRSILGRLWDELEASRPDCSFLVITHDLEFAASRPGVKFVVRNFTPESGWNIEPVPEADGFSEEVVTLILGSRKPILFVEGERGSLDAAFYRACYPDWTIVPRGGCEAVMHAVRTLRNNAEFTRVASAGIIDADDRSEAELTALRVDGIFGLPVAEIENLLLLPQVSRAILEMNLLVGNELELKLQEVAEAVFADATREEHVQQVVVNYVRRRIDRMLKVVDLSASRSIEQLTSAVDESVGALDVPALAGAFKAAVSAAVEERDLAKLLSLWDRKRPILAIAARHLRGVRVEEFTSWTVRAIQNSQDDRLRQALRQVLPVVNVP